MLNWERTVSKFMQLWSNLRSSFWFMPSLIVVVSSFLAAESFFSGMWG